MNKLFPAIFIAFTIGLVSCKKNDSGTGEVYGTWRLTETWADPGDGSGRYRKVKGPAKYITIDQSGKMEGDAMPEVLGYKILDSVRMEITSKDYPQPFIYRYKITANDLELNPPCIEGCGFKFKRK
jgi:hypothetical protein